MCGPSEIPKIVFVNTTRPICGQLLETVLKSSKYWRAFSSRALDPFHNDIVLFSGVNSLVFFCLTTYIIVLFNY